MPTPQLNLKNVLQSNLDYWGVTKDRNQSISIGANYKDRKIKQITEKNTNNNKNNRKLQGVSLTT